MSTVQTRMERAVAIEIAKAFVAELEGTYDQLIVAGSLRRRLAMIGDVEIVAVPKVETRPVGGPDLFGDQPTGAVDLLDARASELLEAGTVAKRLDVNGTGRWGPTLKYLLYRDARVDLFTPCAERLGWILLLRTGPYQWSKQLVVPQRDARGRKGRTNDGRPGLMPEHMRAQDGWLTYRTSGQRIETPTERSVFELFGLPYREPWERV